MSDGRTSGPKDRTPGLPGSDKNGRILWDICCQYCIKFIIQMRLDGILVAFEVDAFFNMVYPLHTQTSLMHCE